MHRRPTYSLDEIKAHFSDRDRIHLSREARHDSVALGMSDQDIVDVVQKLTCWNFYKSMRGTKDSRIMHDVYKQMWNGNQLYLKFIRNYDQTMIMLVSCKEDESYV